MIEYHDNIAQGSDEWVAIRLGRLTASEMHLIITPTLKVADNDKSRAHHYQLASQRITSYIEPQYISDDMLRGQSDEIYAREAYSKNYEQVTECGFVTNDDFSGVVGYSPDGLVGDDGLIEIKSRRQHLQVKTILEDIVPAEYMIQIQTGLLVTGRKWLDFISYSGGLPMFVKRVFPDIKMQSAIRAAAICFNLRLNEMVHEYGLKIDGLVKTERIIEEEII